MHQAPGGIHPGAFCVEHMFQNTIMGSERPAMIPIQPVRTMG